MGAPCDGREVLDTAKVFHCQPVGDPNTRIADGNVDSAERAG